VLERVDIALAREGDWATHRVQTGPHPDHAGHPTVTK